MIDSGWTQIYVLTDNGQNSLFPFGVHTCRNTSKVLRFK